MRIETLRLIIRSFQASDIPAYTQIVAIPDVVRFLGDGLPHSPEVAASYVHDCIAREAATGISRYGVHLKESDQLIGFCGFKQVSGYVDFGWRYGRNYWGNGYAKEAAAAVLQYGLCTLALSEIVATSFEENVASVRIIERLGFVLHERTEINGRSFLRFVQPADQGFRFFQPGPLRDGELNLTLASTSLGDPVTGDPPTYRFEMTAGPIHHRVGNINLRISQNAFIVMYRGHIGYGVEPAHRGHCYAARSCRLLLPLARQHGLGTVWITCNPDNIASRRTCELAGADFVGIVDVPTDSIMYQHGVRQKCRYRISV